MRWISRSRWNPLTQREGEVATRSQRGRGVRGVQEGWRWERGERKAWREDAREGRGRGGGREAGGRRRGGGGVVGGWDCGGC